eukprot:301099_1
MAEEKQTCGSSTLQAWITKYKLSKLSQKIEEEEITLEFLLSQSQESIKDIAGFLSPSNPIQQKKFVFAVTEYKKLQTHNESDETKLTSMDKPIDETRLNTLIAMGFDKNNAIIALSSQSNDLMKAIEVLTSPEINKKNNNVITSIWDENKGIGKLIKINNKLLSLDSIVQVKWNEFNRAYLRQIIESDNKTHRFKFDLKYIDKPQYFDAAPYGIYIGIAQHKVDSFDTKGDVLDTRGVYVFNGWGGKICTFDKSKKYGKDCVSGDILEMIVDTYKYTLSYSINGKDYGFATKIAGQKWRVVVAFHNPRHKIEFVSYSSK